MNVIHDDELYNVLTKPFNYGFLDPIHYFVPIIHDKTSRFPVIFSNFPFDLKEDFIIDWMKMIDDINFTGCTQHFNYSSNCPANRWTAYYKSPPKTLLALNSQYIRINNFRIKWSWSNLKNFCETCESVGHLSVDCPIKTEIVSSIEIDEMLDELFTQANNTSSSSTRTRQLNRNKNNNNKTPIKKPRSNANYRPKTKVYRPKNNSGLSSPTISLSVSNNSSPTNTLNSNTADALAINDTLLPTNTTDNPDSSLDTSTVSSIGDKTNNNVTSASSFSNPTEDNSNMITIEDSNNQILSHNSSPYKPANYSKKRTRSDRSPGSISPSEDYNYIGVTKIFQDPCYSSVKSNGQR